MARPLPLCVLLVALAAPASGQAAGISIERPADCHPLITIQKHGCQVETLALCGTGDAAYWRSEAYLDTGLDSVSVSTLDGKLIEYTSASTTYGFIADLSASTVVQIEDLLRDGHGRVTQSGNFRINSFLRPATLSLDLTQVAPVELAPGVVLQRFQSSGFMQFPPPMPPIAAEGFSYYHAPTGAIFGGESFVDLPGAERDPIPTAPAAIATQGQPGFDDSIPTFDCGQISFNVTDEKAHHS